MEITKQERLDFVKNKIEAYKQMIMGEEYSIRFLETVRLVKARGEIEKLTKEVKSKTLSKGKLRQSKELLVAYRSMLSSTLAEIEGNKMKIEDCHAAVKLFEQEIDELSK